MELASSLVYLCVPYGFQATIISLYSIYPLLLVMETPCGLHAVLTDTFYTT
jgi:hypothetical protein